MAEPLTDPEIAALGERLAALKVALEKQDADSASWRAPVAIDQQSVGRLSRMDAIQQQAMSEAEARRRGSDLVRIAAAQTRIAEGEYGYCAVCGEPVAAKRLEIDPMATHCIGCAR